MTHAMTANSSWFGVKPNPPGMPPGPPPDPPPPPPPVAAFLPAIPVKSLNLGRRFDLPSDSSFPGFSAPFSPPGKSTSGTLGSDGPAGGSAPGGLGATVLPPLPPNRPSRPAGGGVLPAGLGDCDGVAYKREATRGRKGRDREDRGRERRARRNDIASASRR